MASASPPLPSLVSSLVAGAEALVVQLHFELSTLSELAAAAAAQVLNWVRSEEELQTAAELGEMLLSRQASSGALAGTWPYYEWFPDGEPTKIVYSICAQCVIWMSLVKEALQLKQRGAAIEVKHAARPEVEHVPRPRLSKL